MKKLIVFGLLVGLSAFFYLKKDPRKKTEIKERREEVQPQKVEVEAKQAEEQSEEQTQTKTEKESVEKSALSLDFNQKIDSEKFKQNMMSLKEKDKVE